MASLTRISTRTRALSAVLAMLLLAPLLVAVPLAGPAAAAAGDLDPSFGTNGSTTSGLGGNEAEDVAIQSDGKIVTVGTVNETVGTASTNKYAVSRHLPSGAPDTTFGTNGLVLAQSLDGSDDHATTVAIQPDGKIVAAGHAGGEMGVIRLLPSGDLDTTFSGDGRQKMPGGSGISVAHSAAIAPDGKIVLGGFIRDGGTGSPSNFFVVRLTDDGSFDGTFDGDGIAVTDFSATSSDITEINEIAVAADGAVVAVGFTTVNGTVNKDWAIARYLANGALDLSFSDDGLYVLSPSGLEGDDIADGVAIRPGGRIVVAGEGAPNASDRPLPQVPIQLIQLLDNGSFDTSFGFQNSGRTGAGIDGNFNVRDMLVQPDGTTVIASSANFENAASNGYTGRRVMIQRFAANGSGAGSSSTNFTGGNEIVNAIALQSDGKLVGAGGGDPGFLLFRELGGPQASPPATGRIYATDGDDIYSTREDGSDRRMIVGAGGDTIIQSDPDVSPDGRLIAYASDEVGTLDIWVADVDGSNARSVLARNVSFDADPSFSPDGSRIAFASNLASGNFDIWVVNTDGSGARRITTTPGREAFPDWTPDGKIVFESDQGNGLDVHRIDPDAAVPVAQPLVTDAATDGVPQMAPDDNQVAFVSNRSGSSQVHVLTISTGLTRQITNLPGATATSVAWSPDGDRLAVTTERGGAFSTLDIVRADGTAQVPIATALAGPSWHASLVVRGIATDTTTSPQSVPVDNIGSFQKSSPSVQAAPDLNLSGLPDLNLSGLPDLNLSGLPDLNLSGLPDLNLSGLPDLNLSGLPDLNLSGLPADVIDGLRRITEADLPVTVPGGWAAINATDTNGTGPNLAQLTEQQIDLVTLLQENPSGLAQLNQSNTDYSSSPIGRFSVVSVMLGGTKLRDILAPFDWCERLQQLGKPDCGASVGRLDASLVHLHLAGVPFDDAAYPISLESVTMAEVALAADAPLRRARIDLLKLKDASFGSILVRTLPEPNAVVDCAKPNVSCTDETTLAQAQAAGAVRTGATFAQLGATTDPFTLLETITGILTRGASPFGAVSLVDLGVPGYAGPGSKSVRYEIRYVVPGDVPMFDPSITVDLPPTSAYDRGSSLEGAGPIACCPPNFPITTEPVIDGSRLVFTAPGSFDPGSMIRLGFNAHPGLRTATTSIDVTVEAGGIREVATNRAQVRVAQVNEPNDTALTATPVAPDQLYVGQLAEPGDKDIYSLDLEELNIPARSRVRFSLEHMGVAADMAAYHPANAPQSQALRAPGPASRNVLPLADDDPRLGGEPVAPDTNQEALFLQADGLPLAGVSDNRALEEEYLEVLTTSGVGKLILAVVPDNGAFGPEPYSLRISVDRAVSRPCSPRVFPSGTSTGWAQQGTTSTIDTTTKTLFLVNRDRTADYYGVAGAQKVSSALATLRQDIRVQGAVVAVDSNLGVQRAYEAWDANPCNPELANNVVRAINAYVDSLLPAGHQVQYVVPIGSDETGPPMPRLLDATKSYNEIGFANSLAFTGENNALIGSLAAGYVFSDDAYGLAQVIPSADHYQYLPTAGLGRLVETPDEIALQAANFGTFKGTLDAKTSFTTGFDFVTDMAEAIDAALTARLGDAQTSTLVGDFTKDQFLAAQRNGGNSASVQSLNAHANQFSLVPTKGSERVTTADLQKLDKRLLYSVGCHTGLNVPDVLVAGTNPKAADWAQSVAAKGGIFAGQTGYGLGLPGVVALSERVMALYTEYIAAGMPVGKALGKAKARYFEEAGIYGVYDEKVRSETVLYGLPMYTLFGGEVFATPSASAASTASGPEPTVADGRTGLQSRVVDRSFSFTQGGTAADRFYSVDGVIQATHDRPIQPKQVSLVAPSSAGQLHGVVTTAVTTAADLQVNPLVANVTVGTAASTPSADPTAVAFPGKLAEVTSGPNGQFVVSYPGNFQGERATPGAPLTGVQRLYPTMQQKLLFSTSDDFVAPAVESANAYVTSGLASFVVEATDGDADGVRQVLLLVRDESGTTRSLDLTRVPGTDRWVSAIPVTGTKVEFIVQAVDAAGNVRTVTDKSYYFDAIVAPAAPAGVKVTVTGPPAPKTPWYTSATVAIDAGPGVGIEVSVDGAPYAPLDEKVVISGDSVHVVSYRTANGQSGTQVVPIDTVNPLANIVSPANGAKLNATTRPLLDVECSDATSGIASCGATVDGVVVADGSPVPTGPGVHTVELTATDNAGHTATTTHTYRSLYNFEGFFSPVRNDVVNVVKAGSTVPMKWRLRDANGIVRDLAVVKVIESQKMDCPTGKELEIAIPDLLLEGLKYDLLNEQYHYSWKTQKLWSGCRQFRVKLEDESTRTADFRFT